MAISSLCTKYNQAKSRVHSSVNQIKRNFELVEDDLRFAANIVLASASFYFMFQNFDDYSVLKATGFSILGTATMNSTIKELRNRCVNYFDPYTDAEGLETIAKLKPVSINDQRKVVVIFKTKTDHNGAFKIPVNQIDELHEQFRVGYFTVEKKITEITKIMQLLKKNKINVDHLIWMGHGGDEGNWVELAEEIDLEKPFVRRKNFPGLSEQAHIHFMSCQTGKEGGIAQAFSKSFPEASVYAPITNSTSRLSWMYFDPKMNPGLIQYGKTGEVITRRYKNGVAVPYPNKIEEQCLQEGRKRFALTWLREILD